MPIAKDNPLHILIKSLDKAEKKNFKLYASRNTTSGKAPKFIQLFDLIDKQKLYDEVKLKEYFPKTTGNQFSNLKRNLSTQILKSLRIIHIQKEMNLQIREQQDFAQILYGKGMYLQSLKVLDRAKALATKSNQNFLLLEILEMEKLIESRHITRSRKVKNKVENLIDASTGVKNRVSNASDLANLNLKISGLYIRMGHIKNETQKFLAKEYFATNVEHIKMTNMSFMAKIYLHQAQMWYHYILMDFKKCVRESAQWVDLFNQKTIMIQKDPDLYMRGLHYLLISAFYIRDYKTYFKYYEIFDKFYKRKSTTFNKASSFIYFIYGYNAKLNYLFLKGDYKKAEELIPQLVKKIKELDLLMDTHRKIIFYYKIAWIYFAQNKWSKALDYLNKIDNLERVLRNDILCYTKVMTLLCHLELKNHEWVDNQIANTRRFCKKAGEMNQAIELTLDYISKANAHHITEDYVDFTQLSQKFIKLSSHRYIKRAFIFFNFAQWSASKEQKRSIQQIAADQYRAERQAQK